MIKTSNFLDSKKVLVRGLNWIGDAVMSIPLLWKIREALPEAHLAVMSSGWCADIYRLCPAVDEVLDLPPKNQLFQEFKFANWIRSMSFDSAVILPNSFHSAVIPSLAGIGLRFGYKTDNRGFLLSDAVFPPAKGGHTVLYYKDLLDVLGISWPEGSERFELNLSKALGQQADEILNKEGVNEGDTLIGFSPGAAWGPSKRWPAENFKKAVELLTQKDGRKALLFGSPGDKELTAEIRQGAPQKAIDLAGKFDNLHHLVASIAKCQLLVTNDSGPMHIAAAVGTPVVAFFGPTDENISGPWVADSGKAAILRPENCSPCYNSQCKKNGGYCLATISAELCRQAAEQLLAANAKQDNQF